MITVTLGSARLAALVAGLQQLDVLAGVGRLVAPLPGEVGLVPDLDGVDVAVRAAGLVAVDQGVDEVGVVL